MAKNNDCRCKGKVNNVPHRIAFFVLALIYGIFVLNGQFLLCAGAEESPGADISGSVINDSDISEEFFFYGNEKRDFSIDSKFISATFYADDKGVQVVSLKNNPSDFEWINGSSVAELSEVYRDPDGVMHSFSWEYFGCSVSETTEKLIFEYKSSDKKFVCRQEWFVCRSDEDGAMLLLSHSVESVKGEKITLPDRFSCVNMELRSQSGYYVQYLDKVINDKTVTMQDVITFKAGNSGSFGMSLPMFYFNASGAHGISVGSGVFSAGEATVLNVAVSDECMVMSTDTSCKSVTDATGITSYNYPSFFIAVYNGNNSVGKSFIKNAGMSGMADECGSLPLTYENVVGSFDAQNVEEIRDSFYNMMFHFSVSEASRNTCELIKDELMMCKPEDASRYKYILRSAIFCDFDYTKVGLTDGTEVKKCAAEHDELYRNRLASIMLSGRQYQIFTGYKSDNWDGIEFYDSVNKKGVIFVFRNIESDSQRIVAVQGVDPNMEYKVTSVDGSVSIEKISGADLISGGLNISFSGDSLSDIVFIEEAEVDFADVKILLFGSELSSLELIAISAILIFIIGVVIVAIIVNAQDEYKEKKF